MTSYLLPCVCGRRIPVAASQAGEQLQCECGQKLEVPTLRHLAALERVEERGAAPRPERSWGARQGLVFLGASLIVVAAGCLVFLQLHKPPRITEPLLRSGYLFRPDAAPLKIATMSPADGWIAWEHLQIIQRPLHPYYEMGPLNMYKEAMDNWEGLRFAALAACAVGVLLVGVGLILIPSKRRGRVRR